MTYKEIHKYKKKSQLLKAPHANQIYIHIHIYTFVPTWFIRVEL